MNGSTLHTPRSTLVKQVYIYTYISNRICVRFWFVRIGVIEPVKFYNKGNLSRSRTTQTQIGKKFIVGSYLLFGNFVLTLCCFDESGGAALIGIQLGLPMTKVRVDVEAVLPHLGGGKESSDHNHISP